MFLPCRDIRRWAELAGYRISRLISRVLVHRGRNGQWGQSAVGSLDLMHLIPLSLNKHNEKTNSKAPMALQKDASFVKCKLSFNRIDKVDSLFKRASTWSTGFLWLCWYIRWYIMYIVIDVYEFFCIFACLCWCVCVFCCGCYVAMLYIHIAEK